ncbi:MAG: AAA family ATPase [Victivallales bacterium]|nr:AAA family ATPase [Victivallales bacterium]
MELHIENFAKISKADIVFDGLTVIAGDNNTGKSTVGKVLYSFFRSLSNLDKRIQSERLDSIRAAFEVVPGIASYGDVIPKLLNGDAPELIVADILKSFWDMGEKIGAPRPSEEDSAAIKAMYLKTVLTNIEQAQKTTDIDYGKRILLRVFDCVFHKQYHPLQPSEGVARLVLTVKGQKNVIEFGQETWQRQWPTKFLKKARLITTPDILSLVNVPQLESDKNASRYFEKYSLEILKELREENPLSSASQIASEKLLNDIRQTLDKVIGGVFKRDEQNEFALFEKGHSNPTKAANLSMGLKTFVLLRLMLEKGVLSEKDVLVLDEPENHLHPEWQVIYAKLLVLLQKSFQLTMLVTSHSNFFVNALQRFSISEGIQAQTHFYLSQPDATRPGFCTFLDKEDSASDIMRSFNTAYNSIDEMSGGNK